MSVFGKYLVVLVWLLPLWAIAQEPFWNEWYVPGQNYIKLQTFQDGLYRVSAADLQAAGVSGAGNIDPQSLQLFYRGEEVPIAVRDNGSGSMLYFDFMGWKNDGALDSLMYRLHLPSFSNRPDYQPNLYNSFFTDTTAFFLTWDAANTVSFQPRSYNNFGNRIPEPYFRHRARQDYTNVFFDGGGDQSNVFFYMNPDFTIGEGFVSGGFFPGGSTDAVKKIFDTPGHVNVGNPTHIEMRIAGTSNAFQHIVSIDVNLVERYRDTTAGINIATHAFDYFGNLNNTTIVRAQANASGTVQDRNAACWVRLAYDRDFDLRGANRIVMHDWNEQDTTYLMFLHADVGTEAWIFDRARNERISAQVSGDTLHFLVPGHAGARELYLFTDRTLQSPLIQPQVSLNNISDPNAGAEFVIITHRKFANSAQQYADYRSNNAFNQLSTKVVFIDEIYDEFGYGVMHTWAIKNFCRYALTQWVVKPKHFMIWGKGRNIPKQDALSNYIPVYGRPANDWEYVTNFERDTMDLTPKAGLGRVSIIEDAEGLVYLAKVMDYESQEYQPYMKKAVFLGGGKTGSEFNAIKSSLLNNYMPRFESDPLNGKVTYYQKQSNGFLTNSDQSSEREISQGALIVQFFGHSAENIFDVDILEPNRYTNFNKYPLMLAFGCSGGNYARLAKSYGERTLVEPNRGAIAYIGNSTSGFISQLSSYGRKLYDELLTDGYGLSLGELLQGAMFEYSVSDNAPGNIFTANQLKQMLLQGDPSVRLRVPLKPDLRVTEADMYFPDGHPAALDNQFRLNVIVHNDGRSFQDSFRVSLAQRLPTGQVMQFDTVVMPPVAVDDTIEFVLPNNAGLQSAGLNRFTLRLDPLDRLDEEKENNNEILHEELFLGNLPAIIHPYKYAIVPNAQVKLVASTFSMQAGAINYSFEIDTVPDFTSPFKQRSGPVEGSYAKCEWQLPFSLEPNKVYYWKVRLDNYYPMQWNSASFKYIPGKDGWSQSRFPQFSEDVLTDLIRNEIDQSYEFGTWEEQLHCLIDFAGTSSYFFGAYSSQLFARDGMLFTAIDHNLLRPTIQNLPTGDWRYGSAPSATDLGGVNDLLNAIISTRNDDYFLFATSLNAQWQNWPENALRIFEQIGCRYEDLEGLPFDNRVIILGRKGAPPGSAILLKDYNLVSNSGRFVDLFKVLSATRHQGGITSTIIGPSLDWSSFHLDWQTLDILPGDTVEVDVYGLRQDNTEVLVAQNFDLGQHSLSAIDAGIYPRLRLEGAISDSKQFSTPQMKSWEIYHSPAPDAAIEANLSLQVPDTIIEGQNILVKATAINVSPFDMDSLLVRVQLLNQDRNSSTLCIKRFAPLPAGQSLELSLLCPTASMGLQAGEATLVIELNPNEDQPEQNYFNNFYYHPCQVQTDKIGPIVNVTVDGKHLMSGDIVAPNPEIIIEINDENNYLPVTVSDSTFRIWFGTERSFRLNPEVFISTDNRIEAGVVRMPDNRVRLTFNPGSLPDGEYTLAVQGYDFKGNVASSKEYVIQMNVVNEKAMSEVLPYPNPFSSSCRFVYTLTGGELPQRFDIEIYTISGRLVKVIDLLALGDVHFGQNITDFAWDGRDDFGDLLANGTYIYRVRTKFSGSEEIKLRDEGISGYFKNGFGKLYIMR